jgi:hypothetical protein
MRYLIFVLFILASCSKSQTPELKPNISYQVSDWRVQSMPSPFPPLSEEESKEEWAKEYRIGVALAKELDLYRAVTAFKRALILSVNPPKERKLQMEYYMVLSYYLGHRYEDVISSFQRSSLMDMPKDFPVFRDLLVMLHESYQKTHDKEKSMQILHLLENEDNEIASKIKLGNAIAEGNIASIEPISNVSFLARSQSKELVDFYEKHKKSPTTAKALNAFIPGAGYWYVGQKQTAITSLLLNLTTTAAATYFYLDGNIPAGILMTSFEAGWYFGGIIGAGMAANTYNERLYETNAYRVMQKNDLFPVLSLRYAF